MKKLENIGVIELSIIVPLYNEEESIEPLYQAIVAAVTPLDISYEILFVDDGSCDNTFAIATELSAQDTNLRAIKFRRNYGQTPAMAAGIDNAKGKILITMDGDLQNDPKDIPHFIEKINEGYDIVVGWRHKRQDKLISRKIPSKVANWIIGKVTGVPIKDNGCSLKAYRANIIKNVPLYSEMHRFIPAMASLAGTKVAEIKVRHHARQFGVSKYGLSRIYKVLIDLMTIKTIVSFSSRPMLWFGMLALPSLFISAISMIIAINIYFSDVSSSPIVFSGISIIFAALGCFLIMGGALAELIYKTGDTKVEKLSSLTARYFKQ